MQQVPDVRKCGACGITEGEMDTLPSPRGPMWFCKDRKGCEERTRLVQAAQRGTVLRTAPQATEPDKVDALLAEVDAGKLTFLALCECLLGRMVQVVTTKVQEPAGIVAMLLAVTQDCLVMKGDQGTNILIPFDSILWVVGLPK